MTLGRHRIGLAALAGAAILLGACASGIRSAGTIANVTSSTSTSSSTTTLTPTTPVPTPPPTPAPPGDPIDWDGVRYDYGQVMSATADPAGPVIEFDRWQLWFDGGYGDAKTMTTEPIVYANTDMPGQNENPQLRRLRLAPNAQILGLRNVDDICSTYETGGEAPSPMWVPYTVTDLAAGRIPGMQTPQTSLTFDTSGLVTRVRVSQSC